MTLLSGGVLADKSIRATPQYASDGFSHFLVKFGQFLPSQ
jgi:hypothetical protein